MMKTGAASDEIGALGNGFADESFEVGKINVGYASTDVDGLLFCCCCVLVKAKVIANPQCFDTRG